LVKKDAKSERPVNYTMDNQKITFEFLKSHLWSTADILRGSLDPSEYRQPVMTLLFLKRLNDTFEENAEKLIKQGKSQKDAYENKRRHSFFVPENARRSVLSTATLNMVEKNDNIYRIVERANKDIKDLLHN
jgi:type I restriction enzyme M protein